MIDYVYSAQKSGFEKGFRYRNPRYFVEPKKDAKSVIVVGDWPAIVAAYERAGAKVTVVMSGTPLREPGEIAPPHPLDHDGDGRPGGSIAPKQTEDLPALRAQYEQVVGKRPFPGWDAAELRRRMAEAQK